MGVYRYNHEWCGFNQDVYLEGEERENINMPCYRCGRAITARKVRDKSTTVGRADGEVGILRHDKNKNRRRGS